MAQLSNTTINGSLVVNGYGEISHVGTSDDSIVNKVYVDERTQDYIIEQNKIINTNQQYTTKITIDSYCIYRKWNSGYLEIDGWCKQSDNANITVGSWFGGYESSYQYLWGEYPIQFLNPPMVTYTFTGGDGDTPGDFLIIQSTGTEIGQYLTQNQYPPVFKLLRGTTRVISHPQYNWRATGFWK